MEDLFKYKEHDAHDEFVEYMRSVCMPIKAVDFEFQFDICFIRYII